MKHINNYILEKLKINKKIHLTDDYDKAFHEVKKYARMFVGLNGWNPGEYSFKKFKDGTFGIHFKEKYSSVRLIKIWHGFYKELEERDVLNTILNKHDEVEIDITKSDVLYKMNPNLV